MTMTLDEIMRLRLQAFSCDMHFESEEEKEFRKLCTRLKGNDPTFRLVKINFSRNGQAEGLAEALKRSKYVECFEIMGIYDYDYSMNRSGKVSLSKAIAKHPSIRSVKLAGYNAAFSELLKELASSTVLTNLELRKVGEYDVTLLSRLLTRRARSKDLP